jgi:hypothetical protein
MHQFRSLGFGAFGRANCPNAWNCESVWASKQMYDSGGAIEQLAAVKRGSNSSSLLPSGTPRHLGVIVADRGFRIFFVRIKEWRKCNRISARRRAEYLRVTVARDIFGRRLNSGAMKEADLEFVYITSEGIWRAFRSHLYEH